MTAKEFIYSIPEKVDSSKLEGVETCFHVDLSADDGGQYTIEVVNEEVNVYDGLLGESKCLVTTKEKHFMNLLRGKLNPMMAVLTGKIKISNQGEMMKYAKLLGLM